MSRKLSELEAELLQLPPNDRALLANHLLASLESEDDGDVEQAWLEEAERRYRAYREGKMGARPADEVLRDARVKTGLPGKL